MLRQITKIGLLALLIGSLLQDPAFAQYRGWGDNDGNRWDRYRGGDDRDEMRRRYEEMRSRYGGGGFPGGGFPGGGFPGGGFPGGGFPGGYDRRDRDDDDDRRGDDRRDDDRSRDGRSGDSRSGNSKPRVQPFVPQAHTPVCVDIPANYAAGDSDGDRQIDLLEWRQWKPQEIANFMMMDTNRDGFLTARELIIAERNPPVASAGTSGNVAPVSQAPTPTQTPATPDADGNTPEKPSAAEARYVFGQLDKNFSGKIEEDEWKASKSVRGGFERLGITLPLPADQATFFNLYPPQRIVPTVILPN